MKQRRGWVAMAAAIGMAGLAGAEDFYAAQNGQPPGDFKSWGTAASNIQEAVNAAGTNDTIWIGAGRYTVPPSPGVYDGTNVVYLNKPLTLRSSNGLPESVVIDGGGSNRGIAAAYNVTTTNRFRLLGLTVSNGLATNYGGGIYFYAFNRIWTGEVNDCVIRGNTARDGGGIVWYGDSTASALRLSNTVVEANEATNNYGGLYAYKLGYLTIADSRVSSNRSAAYGGGLYLYVVGTGLVERSLIHYNQSTNMAGGFGVYGTRLFVNECVIHDNQVTATNRPTNQTGGGGIRLDTAPLVMRNSLMYNNYSEKEGGALRTQNNNPKVSLYNCTIVSNQGNTYGAISISSATGLELRMGNTIVYSNAARDLTGVSSIYLTNGAICSFTNSCLTNALLAGSGNITNPPGFVDFAAGDFRLAADSPCLNTGLREDWMEGAADLDGRPRVDRFYRAVDMGCYERVPRGSLFGLR